MREPLVVAARGVDNEAPYFVDMIGRAGQRALPEGAGRLAERGRLHDARPQPAARRARRHPQRPRQGGQAARGTPPAPGPHHPVGADRRRSEVRGNPRARGRTLLQHVAVQPRHGEPAAARLGVQAVRVPVGLRLRRARGAHRSHAGDDHARRTGHLRPRHRRAVGAAQLRRGVRGRNHLAARAGDVAQPRHRPRGRGGRLRHRRRRSGAASASARRRAGSRRSRSASSS